MIHLVLPMITALPTISPITALPISLGKKVGKKRRYQLLVAEIYSEKAQQTPEPERATAEQPVSTALSPPVSFSRLCRRCSGL